MKVIIKTESETFVELDSSDMTDNIIDQLKESFDHRHIVKLEIVFNEGIILEQCQRFEDIEEEMISSITTTIK
jgi:RNA-binding protein YhbY